MAKVKDLTGQRFGRLTVMGPTEMRKNRFMVWECKCDCGNTAYVVGAYLTNGRTKSCGCLREDNHVARLLDLTGQRFGRLLAIRPTEERKNSSVVWECLCDCGNTVFVRSQSLQKGVTQSCGCLQSESKKMNLEGKRFGRLLAVRPTEERKNGYVVWECQCDCGETAYIRSNALLRGSTQSCGCLREGKSETRQPDLTGQRFGRLVVLQDSGKRQNFQILWDCQCDCGEIKTVNGYSLRRGATQSCGCLRSENTARINGKDLTGKRFGKLTALQKVKTQNNHVIWECRCDCGKVVRVFRSNLTSGKTKSCGCISKEREQWVSPELSVSI